MRRLLFLLLDKVRQGPKIKLCFGGVARDLVREMPLGAKTQGITMADGGWFILSALVHQFMPLEEESNLHAFADLRGFCRLPGENTETLLARFEVILQGARTRAQVPLQSIHDASMLLLARRLPTEDWVHLLTPVRGA